MSWVLTRENDEEFSMVFDTSEEAANYMHSVDSDVEISWVCKEV